MRGYCDKYLAMMKIQVVSSNGMLLSNGNSVCFNELGGNIGRADGNMLVLNDPTKTISRIHATISFRTGQYFIKGLGKLPLYLNDMQLANDQDIPIHTGDMIKIGSYQLQVIDQLEVIADRPEQLGVADFDPFAPNRQQTPTSIKGVQKSTTDFDPFAGIVPAPNSLLNELDKATAHTTNLVNLQPDQKDTGSGLTDILATRDPTISKGSESVDDPLIAMMGFSAEEGAPSSPSAQVPEINAPMPPIRVKSAESVSDSIAMSSESVKKDKFLSNEVNKPLVRDSINSVDQIRKTTSSSADELLQAFLAGAGITNQMNPIELTPELMKLIGMLLRESTQGTLDLLAARANIRKEMRAEMTIIAAKDNNPLKFSPRVEVALNHLLNYKGEEQGFMPPLPSIRDAYDDLRSHQFGFLAGMRATLSDLLNRFSPDQLEKRLVQKNWVDSILPSSRKAKLWNLFAEQYEKISQEAQEDIDTVFSKAFLQAYEDQVARLDQIKKKE